MPEAVVVTGVGVVSALGLDHRTFWERLLAGTSAVTPVVGFDPSGFETRVAAQIHDFDPARACRRERSGEYGRTSQLAIAAAREALLVAGLDAQALGEERRIPVVMGTTMGESDVHLSLVEDLVAGGYPGLRSRDVVRLPDCLLAIHVAHELGLDACPLVIPTACAAGNYAIARAYDYLRSGRARVALAGGSDAFSRIAFMGFSRMFSLAPERCQPFDRNRKGIVIGEGAAVLALETRSHARARGARILAELRGYGLTCDAHHMTAPHADGVERVMRSALSDAGVPPGEVDMVSAHGTGTPLNDKTECEALGRVFGEGLSRVMVPSIKSMLGHCMGAASALEAVACVLAISEGRVPPTVNYQDPDPECPIDCVPNAARRAEVRIALNNSFAFGGNNAATVFARSG